MEALGVADSYIFWADEGDCSLLDAHEIPVVYHESCGNFGGLKYVKVMLNALSSFRVEPNDFVIFCDDDITMLKNPMPDMDGFDHGGIFGDALVCDNIPHVSGQLNIIKGWLWNEYVKGNEYILDLLYRYQCTHNSQAGTADDTLFSIFAYLNGAKQKSFHGKRYWIHDR